MKKIWALPSCRTGLSSHIFSIVSSQGHVHSPKFKPRNPPKGGLHALQPNGILRVASHLINTTALKVNKWYHQEISMRSLQCGVFTLCSRSIGKTVALGDPERCDNARAPMRCVLNRAGSSAPTRPLIIPRARFPIGRSVLSRLTGNGRQ